MINPLPIALSNIYRPVVARFDVKYNYLVKTRAGLPEDCIWRGIVSEDFSLEIHVDIAEGNALGVKNLDMVELIKQEANMNNIGSMIDHTLLKADARKEAIERLCKEAIENKFIAICVNPTHVELCKEILKDTDVKIATVVGFPLGANTKETKAFETSDAINKGATEIDMVINIGALKDKDYKKVEEDIRAVVEAAKGQATVKVIIETSLLNKEEKIKACELAMAANADFVKTSTGFSTGGATLEDVNLMKSIVGEKLQVKASGGVRDKLTAQQMIDAGATRLGTSSGVKIVQGN